MELELIKKFIDRKLTPVELRKEVLRNDFSAFIYKTFNTINHGTKYNHNWHIDLIAEYLNH